MIERKIRRGLFAKISLLPALMMWFLAAAGSMTGIGQTPENPGPWIPEITNIRSVADAISKSPYKNWLSVGADGVTPISIPKTMLRAASAGSFSSVRTDGPTIS
jgi:hypothetical protein